MTRIVLEQIKGDKQILILNIKYSAHLKKLIFQPNLKNSNLVKWVFLIEETPWITGQENLKLKLKLRQAIARQ